MDKQKDMSEEVFDEIIDNFEVFGKLTLWGRKNIKHHVKRLQEENSHLKKILNTMGLDANKILYFEKENKELKKYCCKRNDCGGRLKENNKPTDNEIITEFEKWLEELLKEMKNTPADDIHQQVQKDCVLSIVDSILDKLQELKEGKK